MFRKINLLLAILATLILSDLALALTVVPLNTGYDHTLTWPTKYPTVSINPSTVRDDYWINIASYPATSPSVDSSWVISTAGGWAAAMPNSNWISARNTNVSPPGTNEENPAYTIFRKCYCLLQGFKQAQLNFQVRADDKIQVWLNTITNQVLAPSPGHFGSTPLSGSTAVGFQPGKNCLYVLVEDNHGGNMGFDMVGNISALGLLQTPAKGVDQTFSPCNCPRKGPAPIMIDEDPMVGEILKVIAARRRSQN